MRRIYGTLLGLRRRQKMAIQVLADSVAIILSFAAAIWLRLGSVNLIENPIVWLAFAPALPVALLLLQVLGFYRAVIRYISARALQSVLLAALVSGLVLAVMARVFSQPIPMAVPLIYAVLVLLTVGGSRYVFREVVYQTLNRYRERVVVYGAGAAGRQLVQTLRQGSDYLPLAFLDDDPRTHGMMVAGFRVHPPEKIEQLIRNNAVTSVLLAIPSATKARRTEILRWLEQFPLHLRTVPGLHDIVSGVARIDEINEVALEDLLGRDPVPPRDDLMGATITGKSVLVTGAGGTIGSELCRQILRQAPLKLVLMDISEPALYAIEQELNLLRGDRSPVKIVPVLGSVRDRSFVERCLRQFGIDTVYHAAAYKHVPLVEHNVGEGIRNNVFGTKILADAALSCGVASFILISTDKAVRPTNIMGASKRLAELYCQALARAPHARTTYSMVRFGNVLGSSGSVIPLFRRQIAAGGPITVTHPEVTRFFMTIPEAAQLVIQAGAMARGGDVFVLNMGEPIRIAELAVQMARLHGLKARLQTENTVIGPGEIGIVFTRLRPGEKLYEELLIGNSPQGTAHPRIMTSVESHLPLPEISRILQDLEQACDRSDVEEIRRLLDQARTEYQPHTDVVDHFALTALPDAGQDTTTGTSEEQVAKWPLPEGKHLTLVRK